MATDAALGKVFEMLFDLVKEAIVKVAKFKSTLNEIKSKLISLEPVIRDITKLKMALDQTGGTTNNLESLMNEGLELIGMCLKVKKWMLWKKGKYCDMLREFNEKLQEEIQALPVEIARDGKLILLHVIEIERDGKESLEIVRDLSRNEKETSMVIRGLSNKSDETFGLVQEVAFDQKQTIELVQEMHLRLKEVLELNKESKESNIHEFLDSCEVPKMPQFTVGLDVPLEELKKKLLEGGTSVLVVTALGGCGKTTLAIKFCHDDRVKGSFHNIFFVNVSKTPTLVDIAKVISQHKGHHLPLLVEANAIKYLQELPEQKGQGLILLVLDDAKFESQSILTKVSGILNYKILVTSRKPLKGFQTYPLRTLNDKDAMRLFRHSASLVDGNSNIPEDLVKKIVEHCKEFPLALEVVGKSLREQPQEIWLKKLDSTLKSEDDHSEDVLYDRLQSCLDDLKRVTLKECFIDLGLFPEDQRIPAAALIDMWSELYGKEDDRLVIGELLDLTNHGLANLVVTRKDTNEMDGYYSEHFVTIHDLLRELAILQDKEDPEDKRKRLVVDFKGNSFPKWWKDLKQQQSFNAQILSISTDDKFSSKWKNMHVPQAEVLVLNFRTKNYALPVFVDKMDNLKVLVITNYGIFPAELRDFHLLGSLIHLKRIRLELISIPSLIKTPVQLNNLQKISFFMCSIGQAFSKVSSSKLFPNLEELNIDFCNDLEELPAGLCDLVQLKKLSITHCHRLSSLPKEIGNLESLEILRLRSCIDLSELPDSINKLYELNFLDISNCISLRSLPRDIGELSNLRTINMTDCSRLPELPPSILDLENLQCVLCDEEVKELWEKYLPADSTCIELKVTQEEINLNWLRNLRL